MSGQSKPLIVLLCLDYYDLFKAVHAHLISALEARSEVHIAKTRAEALRFLFSTSRPRAVIACDAAVTRAEYLEVHHHLVEYVRAGGTAIYAGALSSMISSYAMESIFKVAWGLPWSKGTYHRETYVQNERVKSIDHKQLEKSYSMKAHCVSNVSPEHALYVAQYEVRKLRQGQVEAAVAFAPVGKGRLGYVGDVNGEFATTAVVIAMCFYPSSRAPAAPGTGVSLSARNSVSATSPAQEPSILIMSFIGISDHERYAQLYRALRRNASVTEVWDSRAALQALSSPHRFSGVLIVDGAPMEPEHSQIASRLAEYTRSGARVVLGLDVGGTVSPPSMKPFFARWGLPWTKGDYGRNTLLLNPAGPPKPLRATALFPSVNVKALYAKNVQREHAVYVVGPDGWVGRDEDESPAVFARVGQGYLGYVGDVNGEQQSIRLLIEMLGVTIHPGDMGPRTVIQSVSYSGGEETSRKTVLEEEIPLPPPRRAREAEVAARAASRARVQAQKKARADRLKDEGNHFYRRSEWLQAAEKYQAAALIAGPDPTYMSNLAAALLNLKLWEAADSAASRGLMQDPINIKLLYRRAVARRALSRYKAAEADLRRLLTLDRNNQSAKTEFNAVRRMTRNEQGHDWPEDEEMMDALNPNHDGPVIVEEESDSEDYSHAGNGTPCKSYNHGGCSNGNSCRYQHAPDMKSVRDELGRNVCVYWLLGTCRYGDERCIYAHDRTYLPKEGWWTNTRRVDRMRRRFAKAVEAAPRPGVAEHVLAESLKPTPWRRDIWAYENLKEAVKLQQLLEADEREYSDDGLSMADERDYVVRLGGMTLVPQSEGEEEEDEDEQEWLEPWEVQLEEREMYAGHTRADFEEMVMYGIRPWDVDAMDQLQAIRDQMD
ncbi:TPR-like protein [Trametes sanguinea]|nr:TPR-like protein [Trametes sanguinea]